MDYGVVCKYLRSPLHFACFLWSMLSTMLINSLMSLRGSSRTRCSVILLDYGTLLDSGNTAGYEEVTRVF